MFKFLKRLFKRKPSKDLGRPDGYGTTSEFIAEVVLITGITKHPKADRLEFAAFSTLDGPSNYQVIVGKGDFVEGQLAAYFSVDVVVPLDRPEFRFLSEREDGKGKDKYRLRAARLRGEFSQGLLTRLPSDGYKLGQYLGDEFGVTYYTPPEIDEPAKVSNKKPKPQPMPVYGVDSLKKRSGLFVEDEQVRITEKIHGTNFRFGWVRRRFLGIPVGYRFVVGSHRAIKDSTGGGYYSEDLWNQYAKEHNLKERSSTIKGAIFYGEIFGVTKGGQKIQDLTYGRLFPDCRLFDVLGPRGWGTPSDLADCGIVLGLKLVPTLYSGPYAPGMEEAWAEGKSLLYPEQIREGCVVESLENHGVPRRKAKYVSEAYLLRKGA